MTVGPAMTARPRPLARDRRSALDRRRRRSSPTGADVLGARRDGDRQHDRGQRHHRGPDRGAARGGHRSGDRRRRRRPGAQGRGYRDGPDRGQPRRTRPIRSASSPPSAVWRSRLLVGVVLAAAAARVPVVLDGFITGAAALVADGLAPRSSDRGCIAAHRSVEPGHAVVLERLGLQPLLDLDLRLGEGTGAALAMGLLDAAVRIRDGMATFESAAIAGPGEARRRTGVTPATRPVVLSPRVDGLVRAPLLRPEPIRRSMAAGRDAAERLGARPRAGPATGPGSSRAARVAGRRQTAGAIAAVAGGRAGRSSTRAGDEADCRLGRGPDVRRGRARWTRSWPRGSRPARSRSTGPAARRPRPSRARPRRLVGAAGRPASAAACPRRSAATRRRARDGRGLRIVASPASGRRPSG